MAGERISILYFHSSADRYGSDQALWHLIAQLDREQFEPIVVVPGAGPLTDRLREIKVEVIQHPLRILHRTRKFRFWWRWFSGLIPSAVFFARLIQRRQIKLVHSNTSHVFDGALAAWLTRTPHIWHIREIHAQYPAWFNTLMARLLLGLSTNCLVITEAVRQAMFGKSAAHPKIVTVYDGVAVEDFASRARAEMIDREFGFSDDISLVIMVGRMARWKGQHIFIQAAARVHAQNLQTRFIIIGGPVTEDDVRFDEECRAMVKDQNLEEAILFAGPRPDPRPFYAASAGLVLASVRPEPLGLVVLEAMAAARPVIVTAHGGPMEVVVDRETGWVVPPNDVVALMQAMLALTTEPEAARQLGVAGQTRCRQRFTQAHTMAAILKVYADVLQRKDLVPSVHEAM